MAKKKKTNSLVDLLLLGVAFVLGALVFAWLAMPAVSVSTSLIIVKITGKLSGYEVAFGTDLLDPVTLCLIAFILVIIAVLGTALVLVLLATKKTTGLEKFIGILIGLVFIVAGVFYFCSGVAIGDGVDLEIGAILSAISCIVAGLATGIYGISKLLK